MGGFDLPGQMSSNSLYRLNAECKSCRRLYNWLVCPQMAMVVLNGVSLVSSSTLSLVSVFELSLVSLFRLSLIYSFGGSLVSVFEVLLISLLRLSLINSFGRSLALLLLSFHSILSLFLSKEKHCLIC